jgi:hypothetical protein
MWSLKRSEGFTAAEAVATKQSVAQSNTTRERVFAEFIATSICSDVRPPRTVAKSDRETFYYAEMKIDDRSRRGQDTARLPAIRAQRSL